MQQEIKAELSKKYVSVIFDGTARLGEAFAVVVCFVSDKQLKQRLIKFQMLPKSMTGEEIAWGSHQHSTNSIWNWCKVITGMHA